MSETSTPDVPTLLVEGRIYAGWTEFRVTRAMDQGASDFDFRVSERWPGQTDPWLLRPFLPVVIKLGEDVILTGYIDALTAEGDDTKHSVRVTGRSKTSDLVDCHPERSGTEFRASTLPAIARALAAPFGITVVEEAPAGAPFGVEGKRRNDKAWDTIERLARMRGVIAHDDEEGRLVLTRAGQAQAAGGLTLGGNLLSLKGKHDGSKRYSKYSVLAQRQTGAAAATDGDGDTGDDDPAERASAGVQVSTLGVATDPGVTRYRPYALKAEGAGNAAIARQRALWAAATARAKAITSTLTVQGWRQADGKLWKVNQLVRVVAPWLQLDHELLITRTEFSLTKEGRRTELEVTPKDALIPEPLAEPTGGAGGGRWGDVIRNSGR